jgi:kinesin family protein C2/C3
MYKEELDEVNSLKEAEMQRLRDEVKDLKHELTVLVSQHGDADKIAELEEALGKAEHERHQLKLQLDKSKIPELETFSTVSVYVKVRPFLPSDSTKVPGISSNSTSVILLPVKDKSRQIMPKSFEFEKVYGCKENLDDIFNDLLLSINHFAAGGTCCIMSYGQTGSGKTFTMNGLISKTLDLLSSILSNDAKISFHCIEVYNEQVRNLLSDGQLSKNWKDIISISQIQLQSDWYTTVKKLIQIASAKRATKSTDCNEQSSRSHCIYTFFLSMPNRKSIMQFVDLAGSERISKSSVTGDTLKEALHINKSLSALQDVIAALESKNSHVPYRNSLLTRIFKLSLSASSSKISVILNCSPTEDSINETISTLTLGQRLKSIDLSWAIRKNIKTEEVERTLDLLEKERNEKNSLIRKLEKLERDLDGYITALKERDNKLANLTSKLKQIEKTASEEIDCLRKDLKFSKIKNEEITKKFILVKTKADNEKPKKPSKPKNPKLLFPTSPTPKTEKSSITPLLTKEKKSIDTLNLSISSRIPKPGYISCNTSKLM